jgi:hypothetical protein
LRTAITRAATLHRQAAAITSAAASALGAHSAEPPRTAGQHELAERLRAAAAELAPGWLGAPLAAAAASMPLGGYDMPPYVRVGTAQPLDDARFPAIVPLLTHGHLTIDADARDPRVAGLLRALLLRLLAAAPAGTLQVRVADAAGGGALFARFAPLTESLMPLPLTDRAGVAALLSEAEQWVRLAAGSHPPTRQRLLLLVIASLPELTDGHDLARIAALAQAGPAAGLHLVVAGWPPPPLTTETTQGLLPLATAIAIRNPYAVVGPPPGATFGSGPDSPALNAPVFLDEDPPAELVDRVCRELATHAAAAARLRLADLMPDRPEWTSESAAELAAVVGFAADTPLTLRFNDLTPHWMVGGRSGAGKTALLLNVLFGLATRYPPGELLLYLLDFKEGVSFTEMAPTERDPTWLPHARAIGVESDREYGLAVLRELEAEMGSRATSFKRAGVAKFADLRAAGVAAPRILCVIDEFQVLFAGSDPTATEAVALLESLARKGRSYGIHLVLASQTARGIEALYAKRDSIFGQFPVRIALPGGGDVLDPTNESAAGLPIGAAVVNTAGGFGGPRGAVRGHETKVHFPDPYAEPEYLTELRHRLWAARPDENRTPYVFAGYAEQRLENDSTFLALPHRQPPTVLIGRTIDVELSATAYPLDGTPGRHLAVIGPSRVGLDLLDAVARSLAAQHQPGSARFLLAPRAPDTAGAAARLSALLTAQGHKVTTLGSDALAGTLAELKEPGVPSYLLLFGADAAPLPVDALRAALRDGPAYGNHVFGWWRGLRRFTEDVGPAAREEVAGLAFLNVPGADVSLLLGRAVDWQPRQNRALFYDRHADRTVVFVPFVRPDRVLADQ